MSQRLPKRPSRKRAILRWSALVCSLILGLLTLDYWAYPYGRVVSGRSFNRGENGLWLRYTCFTGVAIFADYTTDRTDWDAYDTLWLRR